jgi:hypothetical protein
MAHESISTAYFIYSPRGSACPNMYPRVSLLGNGSVDTFPWQQIHATVKELLETLFLYDVRCIRREFLCVFHLCKVLAW